MSNDYIKEDTRLINLYSQSATSYLNGSLKSNVEFNFKNILRDLPDVIHSTIGVVSAQIPVSYYTINAYNNVLKVPDYGGTITIPVGNYNATTLIAAMNVQFLTFSFIVCSIIKLTGKLSFSAGGPIFPLSFTRTGSTAWDILGFDTNVASYSGSGSPILTLEAPHPLNLLGIQQLRINSSAFASYNSNSTNMGESNLVGVVQSTAPPFGMILYANQNSYSVLKHKNISLIDIQILDENDNLVDFNNIDWTLTFQLTIFRRVPLPSNSMDYLVPILATLTTIQQDLENNPAGKKVRNDEERVRENAVLSNIPEESQNFNQQDLFNNDSNSLDIMEYNKQLPS
jgi:hypothetical protein